MGKKKINEGLSSLIGQTIALPTIPEDVRVLFIDWALEQYARWCTENHKKVAIERAEVTFPGPFMRLTANRRSFYYRWDSDSGRGVEITRREYPPAAARLSTTTVASMDGPLPSIGSVRRSLCGDVAATREN